MCDSQERLIGYVYDELPPGERQALTAHLATCRECRAELQGLRGTRAHLSLWSPPEPDLGFRVIAGGSAPAPALPRRMRPAPAFAFAAAAVIVLAAAAAIANVEIRYGGGGLVMRTGWAGDTVRPSTPAAATTPVPAGVSADFAALDRRLGQIEAALAAQPSGDAAPMAATTEMRMSDAEMLRRVRQIVSEAEARQETAVARRLLQVVRDFDQQRRTDIALIQRGLDQYQGLTNAEIAQNRDMFNRLVRAASRQEK